MFKARLRLPEGISQSEFSCTRDALTIRGTEYRGPGEKLPVAIGYIRDFLAGEDGECLADI